MNVCTKLLILCCHGYRYQSLLNEKSSEMEELRNRHASTLEKLDRIEKELKQKTREAGQCLFLDHLVMISTILALTDHIAGLYVQSSN